MKRILVVVHVFYPQLWDELAECVRNVSEPHDLTVTYSDESAVAQARLDFPRARFLRCENVGFDIWPFIKALDGIDLAGYDYIVKLHTKRDVILDRPFRFNHANFAGARWRNRLLSFIRTPEAWRRSVARISGDASVGMVADAACILRRNDVPWELTREGFDKGLELARSIGVEPANPQFVGGTMFLARAAIFRPLQGRFAAADFGGELVHSTVTTGHFLERVIGFCACVDGMHIVDPDGILARRRFVGAILDAISPVADFLLRVKHTEGGGLIVKVLKVPVYRRKGRR